MPVVTQIHKLQLKFKDPFINMSYVSVNSKCKQSGWQRGTARHCALRPEFYKQMNFLGLSPRHCGTLPYSFITWFVYSSFLVAKLCLISGEISHHMYGDGGFNVNQTTISEHGAVEGLNANMLKVAVGLSALTFIIMLQAHHNHDPDSPHSGYITGVCHNIAVEVFDSVRFFSIFLAPKMKYFPL